MAILSGIVPAAITPFDQNGRFAPSAFERLLERLYAAGVHGQVVAQLMGHASVDTTLNVYTQVLDGSLRAAVEKVGGELFTIVHQPCPAGASGE